MLDNAHAVFGGGKVTLFDFLDDLKMTRQDAGEQMLGPTLQRLGQQGVVGIAKAVAGDFDRLVHRQPVQIGQQAHQFRSGNRGVGVVELYRHLIGQVFDLVTFRQEAAQQILKRGGGKEILLLQAQFLAGIGGVVGVKHPRQGPRQ